MSMQGLVSSETPRLLAPKRSALAHIPGDEGWPVIGNTLRLLADPKREVEQMAARFGPLSAGPLGRVL